MPRHTSVSSSDDDRPQSKNAQPPPAYNQVTGGSHPVNAPPASVQTTTVILDARPVIYREYFYATLAL